MRSPTTSWTQATLTTLRPPTRKAGAGRADTDGSAARIVHTASESTAKRWAQVCGPRKWPRLFVRENSILGSTSRTHERLCKGREMFGPVWVASWQSASEKHKVVHTCAQLPEREPRKPWVAIYCRSAEGLLPTTKYGPRNAIDTSAVVIAELVGSDNAPRCLSRWISLPWECPNTRTPLEPGWEHQCDSYRILHSSSASVACRNSIACEQHSGEVPVVARCSAPVYTMRVQTLGQIAPDLGRYFDQMSLNA